MKKFFIALIPAAALLTLSGCYDDKDITERVDVLETKVSDLQSLCQTLNTNVSSLQTIVNAYASAITVTSVKTNSDGSYTITFSDGTSASIKNGEKGEKGDKGENGADGQNGQDGKSPVIGVRLDGTVYYWTVDGEYLLDSSGNKIPAQDKNTPLFKTEDGKWYISTDSGSTWSLFSGSGDSIFKGVAVEDGYAVFTLADDTTIKIPMSAALTLTIDGATNYSAVSSSTVTVKYTLTGADENTVVDCIATGNYSAVMDTKNSQIVVTVPSDASSGKVIVFASNSGSSVIKVLNFTGCTFSVSEDAIDAAPAGETISFTVTTDIDKDGYSVVIPDGCDWLSNVQTKAVREDVVSVTAAANNTGADRSAVLSLQQTSTGNELAKVTVNQKSLVSYALVEGCKVLILDNDGVLSAGTDAYLFDGAWLCKWMNYHSFSGGDPDGQDLYGYKSFALNTTDAQYKEGHLNSFTIDAGKAVTVRKWVTNMYYMYHQNDPVEYEIYAYTGEGTPAQSGEWTADWKKIASFSNIGVYDELKKLTRGDYAERLAVGDVIEIDADSAVSARYYRFRFTRNGYAYYGRLTNASSLYPDDYGNGNHWYRTHWLTLSEIRIYEASAN